MACDGFCASTRRAPKASLLPAHVTRSDDGTNRPPCNTGPLLITFGAAAFACTNAASTAYFRSGGTVVTLYVLRCLTIYPINGMLVAAREGGPAAARVMLLRTGRSETTRLVLFRSVVFTVMSLCMCFGYLLLTFNDAFTVMKGTDMLSAVLITRFCMRKGERLSRRELACGVLTLVGIALIAQPPLLFDALRPTRAADGVPPRPSAAGLVFATVAGFLGASVGVLTRLLSEAGGPHDGCAPPATQLSYLMATMLVWFGAIGLACRATGLADADPLWAWARLAWPADAHGWTLVALHCAFVLAAQLAFSAGYRTTRAGIAAFLQLTELAWVYTLDVVVLRERTSLLATVGTALVFCSAIAAARSHEQTNEAKK